MMSFSVNFNYNNCPFMHFHKLKETNDQKGTQDSQSMQMTVSLNSASAQPK